MSLDRLAFFKILRIRSHSPGFPAQCRKMCQENKEVQKISVSKAQTILLSL